MCRVRPGELQHTLQVVLPQGHPKREDHQLRGYQTSCPFRSVLLSEAWVRVHHWSRVCSYFLAVSGSYLLHVRGYPLAAYCNMSVSPALTYVGLTGESVHGGLNSHSSSKVYPDMFHIRIWEKAQLKMDGCYMALDVRDSRFSSADVVLDPTETINWQYHFSQSSFSISL